MISDPIVLICLTVGLALIPIVAGLMTAYLKISIILGMLRQGFGTTQGLGMAVTFALSLVMTFLVMEGTLQSSLDKAGALTIPDLKSSTLSQIGATFVPVFAPWREFMAKHAGARELAVISSLRPAPKEKTEEAITANNAPFVSLLGAFVLTEIKEACRMALLLLIPFLVVDMVVANVLVGLGMHMVSPTVISLPLKLLIFISVDGWLLLTKSIVASYGGV